MVAASLARGPIVLLLAGLSGGCTRPGVREQEFVRAQLGAMPGVDQVRVSCNDRFWSAGSDVCASVSMRDGTALTFLAVGYQSFGPSPSRVRVAEAGGRTPRVVPCEPGAAGAGASAFADIDRGGLLGHHFSPPISGVADALRRHQEVIEELEFWPQCPQFWELQDKQGITYRYCAHAARAPADSPLPCQSSESAK
ncbi:MAG: hypothetical protein A3J29_10715 [Acidobacteria bacterium RIFCSPLOWO2_12_FULL_67_14b]|nr:MAG: hypothetical protein A3J29_10715 [Acidobacteria bacterium RIFCSPLOWO2_12_FULL_67_14b]